MAVGRSPGVGRFEGEGGIGVVEGPIFVHLANDQETTVENGAILTSQRGAGLKEADGLPFRLNGRDLRETVCIHRR